MKNLLAALAGMSLAKKPESLKVGFHISSAIEKNYICSLFLTISKI
jgi:hypothetical protein